MRQIQHRVEIFQITERRDGAVYSTKSCGELWIPVDNPNFVKERLGSWYMEVAVSDDKPSMRTVVIVDD